MANVTPDLTDDDKAVLVELLREVIAADRFFLSPRIRRLKVDDSSPRMSATKARYSQTLISW